MGGRVCVVREQSTRTVRSKVSPALGWKAAPSSVMLVVLTFSRYERTLTRGVSTDHAPTVRMHVRGPLARWLSSHPNPRLRLMLSELRAVSPPRTACGDQANRTPSRDRSGDVLIYGSRSEGFICTYDARQQLVTVEVAVIDGRLFGVSPGTELSEVNRSGRARLGSR